MTNPTLVILAAGLGSRYGGLKQVDAVGPSGETIMDYSLFDARNAGFEKVVFVIRKNIEADFRAAFTHNLDGKIDYSFVYQELDILPSGVSLPKDRVKPWGTGHAVMVASGKVHEPFAVINADDFYGREAYQAMATFLRNKENNNQGKPARYAMAGYALRNTLSDFGHVSRGVCDLDAHGMLQKVTERTHIQRKGMDIASSDGNALSLSPDASVSMNFWGFTPSFFLHLETLFQHFISKAENLQTAEFYLSSAIDTLIHTGEATVEVLPSPAQWFGVTYQEDKPDVMLKIRDLISKGIYPNNLWNS